MKTSKAAFRPVPYLQLFSVRRQLSKFPLLQEDQVLFKPLFLVSTQVREFAVFLPTTSASVAEKVLTRACDSTSPGVSRLGFLLCGRSDQHLNW